jgi:hypothetical protein
VPTRNIHWNTTERRVRQCTAVLVIGSPHEQTVTEERCRKEARENTKQFDAEAKKEHNKREAGLQHRRNLLQERVQNDNRHSEERKTASYLTRFFLHLRR